MCEVESTIKQLGGQLYKDRKKNNNHREKERAKKVRDCNKCSQPINEELAKCEEWEIKRKTKFEKILELPCPHSCPHSGIKISETPAANEITICSDCKYKVYPCDMCLNKSIESCKCQIWSLGVSSGPYEGYMPPAFLDFPILICKECGKGKTRSNEEGDSSPCSENCKGQKNLPNKQKQALLSALNQLQQFFIANNIHSITNQNGNLVITFNTNIASPSQTITEEELSETSTLMEPEQKSMWKEFKDYLKKTGKNKMDKQALEQEISKLQTQSEQKPDETKI
ncbi:MAG: hypothetical protein NY202_03260 [Mollicutes bacterium UO1]